MGSKKYLKWYNQVGYGFGALGNNILYALPTYFVMIYMTDSVGLRAGMIGTLMVVSKLFDGFTDIVCGRLIDRTHTKMGKARPWMFFSMFGAAVCLTATFAIPERLGTTAKYAWFFIFYTSVNAIFYTANSIAYNALTALATKNESERVGMGTWSVVGGYIAQIGLGYLGVSLSSAYGWRNTAIIFSVIALVFNSITFLTIKELPEEELNASDETEEEQENATDETGEKVSFWKAMKVLFTNRFYIIILAIMILVYVYAGLSSVGTYWFTYIMGDAGKLGTYSLCIGIPAYVGVLLNVPLVKKFGVYKTVFGTEILTALFFGIAIPFGLSGNFALFVVMCALANLFSSPYNCCLNTMIAKASDYSFNKDHVRLAGTMYSCTSVGIKVGSALGTGLCGWLLELGNYVANAKVQPASSIAVLNFMFVIAPFIIFAVIALLCGLMDIDKAQAKLNKTIVAKNE
ncbi:MFS transporter [Eubacterium sp. am_0171]|uniref:Inner membrane symporter yicJ n=1 Tax=Faecalicatena contorta TaxID=39482 RepID=A0A174GTR7_9FIRM|nr:MULTISPECIES: MFS transporter [Clostridia]MSC86007.1 MFS transporter [Eubacterium sp. BIOML-A1]MSD06252.1 MFS transporter [Eubacterium sp. BIOML-A2]RYT21051.1 MFS transporter [Eubacterium sp. am_0171]CUO66092.1 Inner membrane symporter yicJ [[Eubacterium] contortum] [Faecalicatena contorta]